MNTNRAQYCPLIMFSFVLFGKNLPVKCISQCNVYKIPSTTRHKPTAIILLRTDEAMILSRHARVGVRGTRKLEQKKFSVPPVK